MNSRNLTLRALLSLCQSPVAMGAMFLAATLASRGADWGQYRGSAFDGSSPEKLSAKKWPTEGPQQLWKVPLKGGFSSFTVSQGRACTLVLRNIDGAEQETCLCLDAVTGKELWAVALGTIKINSGGESGTPDNRGGDGPRSTPTLNDGNVYVMSAKLVLSCLQGATGKVIWKKDLLQEHAGRNVSWENAASPVIDGDMVFVAGGGLGESLLGINKKSGKVVWKGQDDKMTHSTPVVATILGQRQVIFFTQTGLVSVTPEKGDVLWRYPFKYNVSTAISPIVSGDIVYCSAGYGVGSSACQIAKADAGGFTATRLWQQPANVINNHWSTPLCQNGYLYGLFGFKEYGNCPLKCVELTTGKVMWSEAGFGPGGCIFVDGHLLVLGDAGQLVLVEATPKAYTEVSRAKVLTGKCWSMPVLSNGRIYARSTKEGVCLDASGKSARR